MESPIGKKVRHVKTGQAGICSEQYAFDFTQYMIFVGHGFAKWHYNDIEIIEGGEEDEPEKSGEAGQPSNEGEND